jgi:hypothetical protein
LNREELAWAAGFFDGEGSIGCYITSNGKSYRSPRLMIQIAQTDPEVLERFRDSVGVGRVTGPFSPKTEKSREYWCYRVENFEKIQIIIVQLWQWLSSQKKSDMSKAMKTYLAWANSMICRNGHDMKMGKGNNRFCPTCRSNSAHKSWASRRRVEQFA